MCSDVACANVNNNNNEIPKAWERMLYIYENVIHEYIWNWQKWQTRRICKYSQRNRRAQQFGCTLFKYILLFMKRNCMSLHCTRSITLLLIDGGTPFDATHK